MPARDWPKGTMRPLYMYRDQYPVVVSVNRGATWDPSNLQGNDAQKVGWGNESPVSGFVPQVEHTYALIEGGYAIMNEFQVAIGESTCAARFYGTPVTAGGKAMIEVAEMTKVLPYCLSISSIVTPFSTLYMFLLVRSLWSALPPPDRPSRSWVTLPPNWASMLRTGEEGTCRWARAARASRSSTEPRPGCSTCWETTPAPQLCGPLSACSLIM